MMFIDAKCQKQADRFYAKLDNNSTYKDLKTTLKEYDRILSNDDYLHISSREIFRDYLKKSGEARRAPSNSHLQSRHP